jgi:outer membrane lipoprotein-sorting protein
VKSKSWAQGNDKVFTEYLAPAREKGTKMLKLKDELWTWTPSTDRTIRIAGHMLRQAVLGSDVSYEDFMEDPELSNIYDVKVIGEEEIGDRTCHVLDLTAKVDEIAYYSRRLWVDGERYLPLKEDRFAKSGKLLKTVKIDEVFQIGERWYPKKMTFKDVLKKGDGTQFTIDSIEFDVDVPEHIFSKASLRR